MSVTVSAAQEEAPQDRRLSWRIKLVEQIPARAMQSEQ